MLRLFSHALQKLFCCSAIGTDKLVEEINSILVGSVLITKTALALERRVHVQFVKFILIDRSLDASVSLREV